MAKFEIFSTARHSAMPQAIRATADGGFVGLFFATRLVAQKDGSFTATNEFFVSIFEGETKEGVARVGKDRKVASVDFDKDIDLPALVTLKNGGFGIYRTTYDDDAPPSTRVDIHDETGVRESTLTVKNRPVQPFSQIDRSFGASGSEAAFVDFATETIQRINLKSGMFLAPKKLAEVGHVVHALDAGHVITAFDTGGPEVDFAVSIPTRAGERPEYREKFGPASSFAVTQLMFTAGNTIVVPVAVFNGNDLGLTLVVRRPDDAKFLKSVDFSKPDQAAVFATTEIKGVGFAVFVAYTKLAKPSAAADAVLQLFDFEGDLIAQTTVKSAIGERIDFISRDMLLTQLNGLDAGSGIRLMPTWGVVTQGKTEAESDESWFGEVFEFNVGLDNRGTSLADMMQGFGKADRLRGSDGDDLLLGEGGGDHLEGGGGKDELRGGLGKDALFGGSSDDRLFGDDGNDTLHGGTGRDQMSGGKGKDLFVFKSNGETAAGSRIDQIRDFAAREGDRIDLRGIDANSKAKGDQVFNFIGRTDLSGTRGELAVERKDGNTVVLGDVNGDGVADFSIELIGKINLVAEDFLL